MSCAIDRIVAYSLTNHWNLTPDMLAVVADVLASKIAAVNRDPAVIEASLAKRKNLPQPRQGNTAVIPVYGVLAPRGNLFNDVSGMTSYDDLTNQLRAAVADKTIRNILLDVDSPGGSVAGNSEFAQEVMKARRSKPVVAQAQYVMASAAYQIGAAATEIVGAPSAQIGGIGTYSIHNDLSKALEQLGIKRTYISAGEGKVDGNETEPLSARALGRRQLAVNQAYDMFVTNVVRGRGAGVTADQVRNEWKADVYSAADAKDIGMIDRVATLDETLNRLTEGEPADDAARQERLTTDTPQARDLGSGQDRRQDREFERFTFELQLLRLTEEQEHASHQH
jgi:signal peptide peptidase SppA